MIDHDPFDDPGPPIRVPPPDPARAALVLAIRERQERFQKVVDAMISVYRAFDKTRRPDLKVGLKEVYERMKVLGESLGIGRVGLDNLWVG